MKQRLGFSAILLRFSVYTQHLDYTFDIARTAQETICKADYLPLSFMVKTLVCLNTSFPNLCSNVSRQPML
jgi:hypothetical protein